MELTQVVRAWLVVVATWIFALRAEAQDVFAGSDGMDGEWMTSGLAPLVLLLGLGIIVALVAAGVAAALVGRRGPRFRGPRMA